MQFRADRNSDSLEKRLNALGKSCFFVNRLDAVRFVASVRVVDCGA